MSQPYKAIDLSLSSSAPRPSLSQSSIHSFGSAPQPIFSQKLIPRDFLSTNSRLLSGTASRSQDTVSGTTFSRNPFQHNVNPEVSETKVFRNNLNDNIVTPKHTSALGDSVQADNGLANSTAIPSSSVTSLPAALKGRSVSLGSSTPSDINSTLPFAMPRTSSIDSAISNVSTTSISRAAGEIRDPSPTSVRNLIATAGGAESLVTHLLKDKNSVAAQNAQLWKLVEKQRALILGLNKDLDRITKERDKYKKRANDLQVHTISEEGESKQQVGGPSKRDHIPAGATNPILQQPILSHANDAEANSQSTSRSGDKHAIAHVRRMQADQDKENVPAGQSSMPILPEPNDGSPESPSLSLPKPKLETKLRAPPGLNIVAPSPLAEKPGKSLPSGRKAPPTPLNLAKGKNDGYNDSEFSTKSEVFESVDEQERGRRRTREEDDRDRELSAMKAEEEARSRSKKNKVPVLLATDENQAPVPTQISAPLPTPGLPLSPRPQHAQTFAAPSSHLTVANASQTASLTERLLAAPLKSPGLPLSPRPINRNDNSSIAVSLPLSPRANMGAFPLSPRAPKHALPVPTNLAVPTDAAALQNKQSRSHQTSPQIGGPLAGDRLHMFQAIGSEPPPVYRGLAVSAYPNLLLPPNALPSIKTQVHSSRLRPSRHTVLGLKNPEETTVFSLSIISRSSGSELWRVEKIPAALPQLEQQLKSHCANLPRMPDRRLFTGQSPSSLDERRGAINTYFDELLDTHVDEQAAVAICRFLSTDVIDPEQLARIVAETSMRSTSPGPPVAKTGYLTKKGKNFGGWKSRFFILDGPDLRYYDSAGGPHLGTIRLHNALIGKQKESDPTDDGETQFRHAFLIQEQKRKEVGNYVRHVLCAESDQERDEWVGALLYWVEAGNPSRGVSRNGSITSTGQDYSEIDDHSRQSSKAGPSSKEPQQQSRDTPTPTSGSSIDSSILDHVSSVKSANISGPMNGSVITDNATWGSKPANVLSHKDLKEKTHKMSNIFGFKKPDAHAPPPEQKLPKPRILRHNGYVRPVFGLPLAEAVEFCAPFNVEADVPAVIYRSIEYLRHKKAANEEGLFRLSGSNVVVRSLKERFNTEGDVDLISEDEIHDVHAVASLFKTYLRELPSTLLTRDLHIEFIKVLELESHADKVASFNALVHTLPAANFALLKEMSKYLLEVTENADKNKMSVRNVGIVFSPTLNIPTPVFTLFLTEYAAIFEHDANQIPEIRTTEVKAPTSLSADDIRSPRHQMFSDLATPAYHQTTFHDQITTPSPPRGTMTGTGEMGFLPLRPVYESGDASANPRNAHSQSAQSLTQVVDVGGFGSLNGLLAPNTSSGSTDKARKRHSQIYMPA